MKIRVPQKILVLSMIFLFSLVLPPAILLHQLNSTQKLIHQQSVYMESLNKQKLMKESFENFRSSGLEHILSWQNSTEEKFELYKNVFLAELKLIDDRFPQKAAQIKLNVEMIHNKVLKAVDAYIDEDRLLGSTLTSEVLRSADNVRIILVELFNGISREQGGINAAVIKNGAGVKMLSFAAIPFTFIIGSLFLWYLFKFPSKPVSRTITAINEITLSNDLTKRIPLKSDDSLAEAAGGLNLFLDKLHEAVSKAKKLTKQSFSISRDISEDIQKIATEKKQEEVLLGELINSVQANLLNASFINELALNVGRNCSKAEGGLENVVDALNSISENSKQMADAVSVIKDIADHTNLLALNAALEASNNGNENKNYAAIAEKMRILAKLSAGSADNISKLMEERERQIAQGSKLSTEAEESLKSIAKDINQISSQLNSISAVAKKKTEAAGRNVSVKESNNEAAGRLALSAQLMAAQANELLASINIFKTKIDRKEPARTNSSDNKQGKDKDVLNHNDSAMGRTLLAEKKKTLVKETFSGSRDEKEVVSNVAVFKTEESKDKEDKLSFG